LPQEGLLNEGIDSLSAADVTDFMARGWTCRLIASGSRSSDGRIAAYVEPVLLSAGEAECAVLKNFNLARYEGKNAGSIAMIGQGAGRWPTASAVLRDLSGIAEGENSMFPADVKNGAADNAAESHAYYVRLPSVCKSRLPAEKILSDEGDVLRLVTEKISVAAMHETVKALRAEGNTVFFAALREG
jgi:homoserine dehydrogenase